MSSYLWYCIHWFCWTLVFVILFPGIFRCRELTTNSENPHTRKWEFRWWRGRWWRGDLGGLSGADCWGLLDYLKLNGMVDSKLFEKRKPHWIRQLQWRGGIGIASSSFLFCSDWCSENLIIVNKNCRQGVFFWRCFGLTAQLFFQMASINRRLFLPATTFSATCTAEVTVHVYDVSRNEKVEIAREPLEILPKILKKIMKTQGCNPPISPPPTKK